jgi:nucleotide-binding universal stress UspA family protein
MYRILVAIDDNEERAKAQAEYVTSLPLDADDVEIVLTHVLHGAEREVPKAMRQPGRVRTVKLAREIVEDAGLDVQIVEAGAPPSDGILDLADDLDVGLIVMGGRKRSPSAKAVFGSTTQAVILDTDLPVVVTGAGFPT